jgi:hypothetical protein
LAWEATQINKVKILISSTKIMRNHGTIQSG